MVGTWIDVVRELEDVVAILSYNGISTLQWSNNGLLTQIQDLQRLRDRQDAVQPTVADIALLKLEMVERFGRLVLRVL